jgi:hypothetical protein
VGLAVAARGSFVRGAGRLSEEWEEAVAEIVAFVSWDSRWREDLEEVFERRENRLSEEVDEVIPFKW